MILVTGATGLVGSHLVLHLLQNGEQVRAIFKDEKSKEKTTNLFHNYQAQHLLERIEWVQADILDVNQLEVAFQQIDQVYHCAAVISFDPRNEQLMRKVNIEGTANMVNFALAYDVKKFCFVSSIATLGDLVIPGKLIDEQDNWNPEKLHSDYAITKYGAEMEVWRGQEEGLNIVIVNPAIILGPGFLTEGSGQIINKIKTGLKFYTEGSSGFVGVQDVVQMMVQLMQKNHFGERYILVSQNLTHLELFEIIAKHYNVQVPSIKVGKTVTSILWKLDWLVSTIFRTQRKLPMAIAKSLHTHDAYDNTKITQQLGMPFQSITQVISEIK